MVLVFNGGAITFSDTVIMQNIPELAEHITLLCTEKSITVEERVSGGGRAYKKDRLICVKPIKSTITYFVALHEIGHIVHPLGSGKGLRLEQEYHAWDWAIDNARIDPNTAVRRMIHRCLSSYIKKAQRSVRMKLPATEHPLWDMLRTMQGGG